MIPIGAWLAGAGVAALWHLFQDKDESDSFSAGLRLAEAIDTTVPCDHVRGQMAGLLYRYLKFERIDCEPGQECYFRGDKGITRLPTDRNVAWRDVPILLTVHYRPGTEKSELEFEYAVPKNVRVHADCVAFIGEHWKQEMTTILDALRRDVRAPRVAPEPPADRSAADLAVLSLSPGASWPQIQAAYRQACLKYHPDRLQGRGVPPHLIELSVREFRVISDAYQRLKARFGQ